MVYLKFSEGLLIFKLMLFPGQPHSPFRSVQIPANSKCTSVFNRVRFFMCALGCVCICVGWSCVEWQGHASWATWIYLGQTRGARVCLGPSSVRSGAWEPRTEGTSSHLAPELLPGWDQALSLYLSLPPPLFLSHPPSYRLVSLFLSLPSVSSPLLSQAMAWPTFTSPTLDSLISTMLALSTDHVYVWKWPICSILGLFMNIHFTNINM